MEQSTVQEVVLPLNQTDKVAFYPENLTVVDITVNDKPQESERPTPTSLRRKDPLTSQSEHELKPTGLKRVKINSGESASTSNKEHNVEVQRMRLLKDLERLNKELEKLNEEKKKREALYKDPEYVKKMKTEIKTLDESAKKWRRVCQEALNHLLGKIQEKERGGELDEREGFEPFDEGNEREYTRGEEDYEDRYYEQPEEEEKIDDSQAKRRGRKAKGPMTLTKLIDAFGIDHKEIRYDTEAEDFLPEEGKGAGK